MILLLFATVGGFIGWEPDRMKGITDACRSWQLIILRLRDPYGVERTTGNTSDMMNAVYQWEQPMRARHFTVRLVTACGLIAALSGGCALAAAKNASTDTARTMAYGKDSAITTKIKVKLAVEHLTSLGDIHVDTKNDGVVWLSGTATSRQAVDKAIAIARATAHVTRVHSSIRIVAHH